VPTPEPTAMGGAYGGASPDFDPTFNPFDETGLTGLKRSSGHIWEEFLPQLQGYRADGVYKEMRDNDPVIGAILYAIDRLVRQVGWRVQAVSKKKDDELAANFVDSCMHDMSHSWEDLISETLSMLVFGWSYHEVVYKRRKGPDQKDSRNRSRYDDGLVGWRKIPVRAQETLISWIFDDKGGIMGMRQSPPPYYNLVDIPIEKALLFRTNAHKNNPQGRSILRNAYRPYWFKKRIEEVEAIGVERDLAGFPVMYVDPQIMRSDASTAQQTVFNDYKELVSNIRRDQQEGVILPAIYDEQGHQLYRLELLSSGGSRAFSTSEIIQRYDQRIAMTCLADFILLGQQNHGSFALSVDKTDLFATSLRTWLEIIRTVFNQYAIPKLFKLNGFDTTRLPTLEFSDIETPPLGELGNYIQVLAGAGVPLFPDDELENYLRGIASLPERDKRSGQQPKVNIPEQGQAQPAQPKAEEPKPNTEAKEK
jgi:hypothetical protein